MSICRPSRIAWIWSLVACLAAGWAGGSGGVRAAEQAVEEADAESTAAAPLSDEAPAGRACLEAAGDLLGRIRQGIPGLIEAAELAAEKVMTGGRVCVGGDRAVALELCRRPGALAVMSPKQAAKGDVLLWVVQPAGDAGEAPPADVKRGLKDSLAEAKKASRQGVTVILLASRHQLEEADLADRADGAAAAILDTHVDGSEAALASLAEVVVGWCFEAELASAVTRHQRALAVWSPPSKTKSATDDQPALAEDQHVEPVAAGRWAEQYLDHLQAVQRELGTGAWDRVARASARGVHALLKGRNLYVTSVIPSAAARLASPESGRPQWLRWLDPYEPGVDVPDRGDFLIALGSDQRPGTEDWGSNVSLLRDATGGVAWVCIDTGSPRERLKRHDVRIDPGWPADDVVLKMPGAAGRRFAPVSTPAAEIVLAILQAQVQADLDKYHHDKPVPATQPQPLIPNP